MLTQAAKPVSHETPTVEEILSRSLDAPPTNTEETGNICHPENYERIFLRYQYFTCTLGNLAYWRTGIYCIMCKKCNDCVHHQRLSLVRVTKPRVLSPDSSKGTKRRRSSEPASIRKVVSGSQQAAMVQLEEERGKEKSIKFSTEDALILKSQRGLPWN